ncbi:MAG: hypothetical protein AMXMBFR42_23310 [Burkholderiales bacterium]
MTTARDDPRDDVVDRVWRDAMQDAPGASLDDAIRAAARRAVGAKPRAESVAEARKPWRWWMPLAAAATIGAIAIGVIQSLPHESMEPTVVSDASPVRQQPRVEPVATPAKPDAAAPAAAAPEITQRSGNAQVSAAQPRAAAQAPQAPAAPSMALSKSAAVERETPAAAPAMATAKRTAEPATQDAPKERSAAGTDTARPQVGASGSAPRRERKDDASAAVPRQNEGFVPAPPASPPASPPPAAAVQAATPGTLQAAPSVAGERDAAGRSKLEAPATRPAPAPASARSSGASASAEVQALAVTPPDTFIAEIRRRLAAGDRDGAIRELQRFRRTHIDADARLPDDLRAFAADVPR